MTLLILEGPDNGPEWSRGHPTEGIGHSGAQLREILKGCLDAWGSRVALGGDGAQMAHYKGRQMYRLWPST